MDKVINCNNFSYVLRQDVRRMGNLQTIDCKANTNDILELVFGWAKVSKTARHKRQNARRLTVVCNATGQLLIFVKKISISHAYESMYEPMS